MAGGCQDATLPLGIHEGLGVGHGVHEGLGGAYGGSTWGMAPMRA